VYKRLTCDSPAVLVVWLAASQTCGNTGALPDVRPPGWLDGAAGAFFGVEGRRTPRSPSRGRRAAAAEPPAEAGLGRPRGARRPGSPALRAGGEEPAGDAGHAAALAPAAGPLAVDLSSQDRTASYVYTTANRCQARSADRADGAGEPRLGLQADPGRAARPRVPGWVRPQCGGS